MAGSSFKNVHIAGIASAIPSAPRPVGENSAFEATEIAKISASTGVADRSLCDETQCTSDLCAAAAETLFREGGCRREEIDALIFVTQTPDYILPATACSLQARLSLPTSCAAFDVNLGCSGYVYGLWLASALLNGGCRRILLLAGDTIGKIASPQDRSVSLLFGDAGTATLLEFDPTAPALHFELGSDGAGAEHLIVPAGGFRNPATATTRERTEREGGNRRSEQDLYMNGGEIFAFTMKRVPEVCRAVLKRAEWDAASVDRFVMHQANRFMLQHIGKLMKLPADKLVVALENCGNTSSASIPLAITLKLRERLQGNPSRIVLAGFGVGFSWAAAAWEPQSILLPELTTLA